MVIVKKSFYFLFVFVLIFLVFSTDVQALNWDTDRYYWACDEPSFDISLAEKCLKKRLIPLSFYPYIGYGLILIAGFGLFSYKRKKHKEK